MEAEENWGVHQTHCCEKHGCKYSRDTECPVYMGMVDQKYPCEICSDEEEEWNYIKNRVIYDVDHLMKEHNIKDQDVKVDIIGLIRKYMI